MRTLQPQADKVELVNPVGEVITELQRIHPNGLYEGRMEGKIQPYRLRLQAGNHRWEIDDPYRFPSPLGELDRHLMAEGTHRRLHDTLGARPIELEGVGGVYFSVWAPNARRVSVVGPFNDWDGRRHPMRLHPGNGVWDIFVPGLGAGELYKFELLGADGNLQPLKADPFARAMEPPPGNASIVHESRY
ncbi:MAG: 1,4-alpha-glucan branching enzyme, partial [Candidatus Competibacterales bacterium]|nr:1,4-alpha-glucan branching enzyme [Candidatus Competibacterales bacterium]